MTYLNSLNDKSVPILFADDTSILVSHPNPLVFYKTNLLYLNLAKTHFIKFISKNNNYSELDINFDNKPIYAITCTRFLGLTVH
jgi:hypothetical protein